MRRHPRPSLVCMGGSLWIAGKQSTSSQEGIIWPLQSRPYSLSRLLIALSDFTLVFWLGFFFYLLPLEGAHPLVAAFKAKAAGCFAAFTGLYALYVLLFCQSRAGDASGTFP